jgi:3-oxoacyl-[acyl-carrier protein] reductase
MAREGAVVVVCSRSLAANQETAEQIKAEGGAAYAYEVDVSDAESVSALVKEVAARFERIDILVNNAGVTADNLLMRLKEAEWDKVVDTNLKGTFNFTKAVARSMIKQHGGKIINVTSVEVRRAGACLTQRNRELCGAWPDTKRDDGVAVGAGEGAGEGTDTSWSDGRS